MDSIDIIKRGQMDMLAKKYNETGDDSIFEDCSQQTIDDIKEIAKQLKESND